MQASGTGRSRQSWRSRRSWPRSSSAARRWPGWAHDVHRRRGAGRRAPGAARAPPVVVRTGDGLRHRGRRCGAGDDRRPGRVFPLFVVGLFLIGAGQAANLVRRYVAADLALPDRRGRAISVRGVDRHARRRARTDLRRPREGRRRERRLQPADGTASSSRARVSVSPQWSWPSLSGRCRERSPSGDFASQHECGGRRRRSGPSFAVIRRFPAPFFLVAVVISQTTMVAVPMTMTPLAIAQPRPVGLSAFVIALHVEGCRPRPVDTAWPRSPRAGHFIHHGASGLGLGTTVSVLAGYQPTLHLQWAVPARPGLELRPDRRRRAAHRVQYRSPRRPRRRAGRRRPAHGGLWQHSAR